MNTINLDKGTYGNTPAALRLVRVINLLQIEDYKRIGKLLSSFNSTLTEMNKVNTRISVGIVHILYHHYIESTKTLNFHCMSFVRNLISARYRQWQKENNARIPKKFRVNGK